MQLCSASRFAFDSGEALNTCHFLEQYQELNIFGSITNVSLLKSRSRQTTLFFSLCVFVLHLHVVQ